MTYLAAIAAVLLAHAPATTTDAVVAQAKQLPAQVAEIRPLEVRIRKLFLVRPDLLQYPIPYDTIC